MSDVDESELCRGSSDWSGSSSTPVREFLRTESGSAGILIGAIVVALLWANVDLHSYESLWQTELSVRLGGRGLDWDLRTWINSGLMTFFFLVVGLEARREFDLGELRDRRRFMLPLAAGLTMMTLPVLIFLLLNAGGSGAHGWGVAMSTDTALALGLLAMLGPDVPTRVRAFMLTVLVVDDLVALVVIATAYTTDLDVLSLVVAVAIFAAMLAAVRLGVRRQAVYVLLGVGFWAALVGSGVDPIVAGLAIGLAASAYTPSRTDLEEATGLVREFREQPTAELARSATVGLRSTLSPNSRLQHLYHPWTSYLIVPLFALANAGVAISGDVLREAATSPVTLGIVLGYVVGKPVAMVGACWLVTTATRGRVRPPVGWAAVLGSGTLAGIGFTVSLLIATRSFDGTLLDQAKLGALATVVLSSAVTWLVYRSTRLLPEGRQARALLGTAEQLFDLVDVVDPQRDHLRGPETASVTVVEYGDFECPYCGQAEPMLRDLLTDSDVRYVWRHLPLTDVHPEAQLAAEAAEAAAAQGAFWPMRDLLLAHQDELRPKDLVQHAARLGLDVDRFRDDLMQHVHSARIAADVESADASGVSGTPTFFVNGQRHYGAYDIDALRAAVDAARLRESITR